MAIGRVLPTWKDWSTRQQGPPSLLSADRGLQCWSGCPDYTHSCDSFVASLSGLDERAGRCEWNLIWLPNERPPLRSLCSGSQCKTDGGAVQQSCPKLLLGIHLWGMFIFTLRGLVLCLGSISLSVVHGQAQLDVEHWDWHPSTLLYFSSCKNFNSPLHLVQYPDS